MKLHLTHLKPGKSNNFQALACPKIQHQEIQMFKPCKSQELASTKKLTQGNSNV